MKKLSGMDWIAIILTVIGGVNWGLVGIFGSSADVVAMIGGGSEGVVARVVYVVVGIAALWLIYTASKVSGGSEQNAGGGDNMSQGM